MDPATVSLILKSVTLGADLLTNGYKAYEANKEAFSSEDQALIDAALAQAISLNDAKEEAALAALRDAQG